MKVDFSFNFAKKLAEEHYEERLPAVIGQTGIITKSYVVNWENRKWKFEVYLDSDFEWKPFNSVTAYEVESKQVARYEWCEVYEN